MGYALVGSLGAVSTSMSPSFGQATSAGNLLVAWIGANDSSATAPFSTTSPGWTIALQAGGAFQWCAVAYKPNCGAGETAPSFSPAESAPATMLGEFSGGATSSPLDQTGNGGNGGGQNQSVSCSAADGQAGNLIIAPVFWNSPGGAATATDTMTDTNGSSVTVHHQTAQPGGAGTIVYDFMWGIAGATLGASGDKITAALSAFSGGCCGIASFKPAGGGAAAATPAPLVVPQAAVMQAANW